MSNERAGVWPHERAALWSGKCPTVSGNWPHVSLPIIPSQVNSRTSSYLYTPVIFYAVLSIIFILIRLIVSLIPSVGRIFHDDSLAYNRIIRLVQKNERALYFMQELLGTLAYSSSYHKHKVRYEV